MLLRLTCIMFLVLSLPNFARASLIDEILDPGHYRALKPTDAIRAADYQFVWETPAPPGLTLEIDPQSLEWMRVRDVLTLPRARAVLYVPANGGDAHWTILSQSPLITPARAGEKTQFAVPLIAHPSVSFALSYAGKTYRLSLAYRPKDPLPAPAVFFDPSCSRFDLQAKDLNPKPVASPHWMIIGCQYDLIASAHGSSANLALLIYAQKSPGKIRIDGGETTADNPTEPIALRVKPLVNSMRSLKISLGDSEKIVHYKLPPVFRRGNIGFGIGPYLFDFEGGGQDIHRTVAMPTLYASATLTDTVRLVAFDATPLGKPWTTDLGFYLTSESAKFFDRRFSFSLMLGGHVLGFQARDGYTFKLGFPQGFEIIGTDILGRGYNFSLGGFIFPSINGKAYNNLWVRWGTRKLFGEINYIVWREDHLAEPYFSRSAGITLGMPLPFLSFL